MYCRGMIFINSYRFASTGGTPTITALNVLYDGTNITLKWAGNNLSGIPFLIQSSPGISQLMVVPNGRVGAGNTSYSITTGFTVGTTYNFTITPQGGGPFSTSCQIGTIGSQITQTQLSPTTKNIQFTTSNYSVGTTFTLYTQDSASGVPPSYFINPSGWTSVGTCTIVSGGGGTFSTVTIPATANYLQIVGQASYSTVNSVTPFIVGSISLAGITQATLSTVNIAWTYSGYGGTEQVIVQQSSDGGATYTNQGSSTLLNNSPLNGVAISAGYYVRLVVTSSLYGSTVTSANRVVYYSLPAPTVTQATSTTATINWSSIVGYLGTDSLIVQQSADGSTGWAQVGSATTISANSGIYSISNNYYVRVQIVEAGTTYPSPASSQFSYTLGTITGLGTSTQSQVTPTTKTIAFNTTIYPNGTTFKLYTQSGATAPTSYQTSTAGWTQLGSTTTITNNSGSFTTVTIPATVSSNPNYYQIVGGTTLYGTSYSTVTQVTAYTLGSISSVGQTQVTSTTKSITFTTTNYPNGTIFTLYTQNGASAPTSYQTSTAGWTQLGSTTTITNNSGSFTTVTIPATVSSNPNYYQIVGGTTLYGTSYSTVTQVTAYTLGSISSVGQTQVTSTTKSITFTTTNYPNGTIFTLYTQNGASAPTSYQTSSSGWTQLGGTTTITGNSGSFSVAIPAIVSSNPNYFQIVGGTALYGTSYSSVTQVSPYSVTALLLHLDSNATDSSPANASMVTQGTPTFTTPGQFGYCMFCGTANANNSMNGLDTPQSGSYIFGLNPFTIDFWFKTTTGNARIMGNCSSIATGTTTITWSAPSWVIGVYNFNRIGWETNTKSLITNPTSGGYVPTPCDGNWHHFAVCRNGANLYMYLDGVVAATSTAYINWTDTAIAANQGVISVGRSGNQNESFNGSIDEVRIVTNAALYPTTQSVGATAFTVPVAAYN